MKKIILTLAAIVAFLLIAPFIVGIQAQSKLTEDLPQMNAASEQYITVKVTDYDRGWFKSTAAVELNFTETYLDSLTNALDQASNDTDPANPPATSNPVINLLSKGVKQDLTISHGPILTVDSTSIGLARVVTSYGQGDTENEQMLRDTLNIDYLIRSQYDIGFSGAGDIYFDVPGFQVKEQGANTSFDGVTAQGTLNLNQLHLTLSGSMPSLAINSEAMTMEVLGTSFNIDSKMVEGLGFGVGGGNFAVDRINLTNPDNNNVELKKLLVNSDAQLNEAGNIDLQLSYEISEASISDDIITELIFAMEMENFDAQAMQQLQEVVLQSNNTEDPAAMLEEISRVAHQMLSTAPTLSIKPVGFTLNDQSFNLNLDITTNVHQLPAVDAFSFDNPMLFMALFSLKGDATINRDLLTTMMIPQLKSQLAAGVPEDTAVTDEQLQQMAEAQAPMLLGTLEGQGFIKVDTANDANYVVDVQFNNGALLINGNPIPLGALQGP